MWLYPCRPQHLDDRYHLKPYTPKCTDAHLEHNPLDDPLPFEILYTDIVADCCGT